ncbi:MAG: LTA synthase family protein [Lactovum sp.]
MFAYFVEMEKLHSRGWADTILIIANPIGFTFLFFSLLLFIKRTQLFYISVTLMEILGTVLVYGNTLYYREFKDFLSIATITGGAGMMGEGFDFTSISLHWYDLIFWIDFIIIFSLIFMKKIKMDTIKPTRLYSFKMVSIGLMLFCMSFWFGDMSKHRLVSRQANDNTYIVRFLGLGPWLVTNGWYTRVAEEARENATENDFLKVQQYVKENRYLAPNIEFVGEGENALAKNRNIIVIHLESFQQDLLDLKINDKEVTPFLNSIYHSNSTYSFSNFYNQVGQGKTSDAEILLETSTFGLSSGSVFTRLGGSRTFQAMPAILNQLEGYSSAVFHANYGSFYNRQNAYLQLGYQNFFDQAYWDKTSDNSTTWGIKDKVLFPQSIQYLEQIQQPFYVKYLTVSNHTPYTGLLKEELDPNFETTDSGSDIVDNYFLTAHYLDESIEEFFNYLKASGLYNSSMIVLYGDHYGITGAATKNYAEAIGQNPITWDDYDNTQMQRVPFMIHIPGQKDGYISDTLAGELDVMPTLEHLLGINTENYIQLGQDLFAEGREDFIALRSGGFITPMILKPKETSNAYYNTKTGEVLALTEEQKVYVANIEQKVTTLLEMSDAINTQDLLRFYTPKGFTEVDSEAYNYDVKPTKERLAEQIELLKAKSTALISQKGKSTVDLFQEKVRPEISTDTTSESSEKGDDK